MTNPNIELFRRTAPIKKLEIIKNLTKAELLSITNDTVAKMVREAGQRQGSSRTKILYIAPDRRQGNNWNSVVETIETHNGRPYVSVYVQYSNTDTTRTTPCLTFFARKDFHGAIEYTDRNGGWQTEYYNYDDNAKARVLKSICLEYIQTKYKDKLG